MINYAVIFTLFSNFWFIFNINSNRIWNYASFCMFDNLIKGCAKVVPAASVIPPLRSTLLSILCFILSFILFHQSIFGVLANGITLILLLIEGAFLVH